MHFDLGNDAAEALYLSRGFVLERKDPEWRIWPKRQSLLSKQLAPWTPHTRSSVAAVSGAVRPSDGVFVWEEGDPADVSEQDADTA